MHIPTTDESYRGAHHPTYKLPVHIGDFRKRPPRRGIRAVSGPKIAAEMRRSTLSPKRPNGPPATEATMLIAMPKVEFITAILCSGLVQVRGQSWLGTC